MVCPVLSRVVSFRRVEGPKRTLVSKTSATCSHHGRRSVFRARAVEQLEMVRKQHLATNNVITSFALTQRFLSSRMRLRWLSVPCARLLIAVGFI